ncbi:hypothetical protein BGZ65_009528 [Modicella reniformis]|uniref:Uncharacterized protein n=1 Tax=Modicella reniformis TaxID=1440133 RepID=A0A9P6IHZ5_9FUNG|nr:hypothetical protein BGZ65_009528 [Modicella reniformis]
MMYGVPTLNHALKLTGCQRNLLQDAEDMLNLNKTRRDTTSLSEAGRNQIVKLFIVKSRPSEAEFVEAWKAIFGASGA